MGDVCIINELDDDAYGGEQKARALGVVCLTNEWAPNSVLLHHIIA